MPFNSQVMSLWFLHFFLPWHRRTALSGPSAQQRTGCRPRWKENTHCMARGSWKGGQCELTASPPPRARALRARGRAATNPSSGCGSSPAAFNTAELIPKSMELFSRQKEMLFLSLFPLAVAPGTRPEGVTLSSLLILGACC